MSLIFTSYGFKMQIIFYFKGSYLVTLNVVVYAFPWENYKIKWRKEKMFWFWSIGDIRSMKHMHMCVCVCARARELVEQTQTELNVNVNFIASNFILI